MSYHCILRLLYSIIILLPTMLQITCIYYLLLIPFILIPPLWEVLLAKGHHLQFCKHIFLLLDKPLQIFFLTMHTFPMFHILHLLNEIVFLLVLHNTYICFRQSLFINLNLSLLFMHHVLYLIFLFHNLIPFLHHMNHLDVPVTILHPL